MEEMLSERWLPRRPALEKLAAGGPREKVKRAKRKKVLSNFEDSKI
jgi:hypothetical protein